MDKIERLKIIKEALRQADANINFEEVPVNYKDKNEEKSNKKYIKMKDENNGKRLLG